MIMSYYNYIDVIYRKYGEEYFGKAVMDKLTDEQIEKARCETNKRISELARMHMAQGGKREDFINNPDINIKKMFCDYVAKNFID